MKQQSEPDRGIRKSNRQRVPNAFYTQGINELKRAPRPARDPPKPPRKRSNVYQEEAQSEPIQPQEEDKSEMIKDAPDWLPCKLPKNGTMIKVQFIVQQPQEPPAPTTTKVEPPKPPAKKPDSAFDLLSLFQKAIENVKDEDIPAEKSAQVQPQPIAKEPKLKKEASMAKPRRQEDSQGRITKVTLTGDKMIIAHSKIGETEFPLMGTQMDLEEAHDGEQEMKEEMDEEKAFQEDVEQYRRRIQAAGVLGQISIFN